MVEIGTGEIRMSWDSLRRALDLPEAVQIVGIEVREADKVSILVSGPGLPVVDQGSDIPCVYPVKIDMLTWQVYLEHKKE